MTKGPFAIPPKVQQTVIALLTADAADLRELARIAGRDPATFYRGANLRRCDLSKSDLVGIDLTGSEKGQARLPKADGKARASRRNESSFDATEIDVEIREFRKILPPEEAEVLEIAFITDLIAKGDSTSLEVAVQVFLRVITTLRSAATAGFRSVWVKLALAPIIPSLLYDGPPGIDHRLLEDGVLARIGVASELANELRRLKSARVGLSRHLDRELIIEVLEDASFQTNDSNIMLEIGIHQTKHDFFSIRTWNRALSFARDYTHAQLIFHRMQELQLPIDISLWNRLLAHRPPFKVAKKLMHAMIAANITPSVDSWNTIISLSPDFPTGRAELVEMIQAGVRPNYVSWNSLLSLAPDYHTGRAVMDEMIAAGMRLNYNSWNILLRLAPDYHSGRAVLDEMIAAGTQPNYVSWNTFLSLAPDYHTGRAVMSEMITMQLAPDAVGWNTLLSLAPDFPTGRAVLGEMIEANIRPNRDAVLKLALLVRNTDDAEFLFDFPSQLKLLNPLILASIIGRLAPTMEAKALLGWVYSSCKAKNFVPRPLAFEPAIVAYQKARRLDQALRIVLPFPHLPASIKLLRKKGTQSHAEAYFQREFDRGSEPFHAAAALSHLYWITGDRQKLEHWVEMSKSYPNQHYKRIEGLNKLLIEPAPRSKP